MGHIDSRVVVRGLTLAAVLLVGLIVIGCAKSETSPGGSGIAVPSALPTSGCGSPMIPKANDPEGLLPKLGSQYVEGYAGYHDPIYPSPWSNWKPTHAPPYTVGVAWGALQNDYQRESLKAIKEELSKDPNVGRVIVTTTGDNVDIGQQIQQFNSTLRQKPDLMMMLVLSGIPFAQAVDEAAEQGIPTVGAGGRVPTKNFVSVQNNNVLDQSRTAARLMLLMGKEGTAMLAHGIVSTDVDTQTEQAFRAVLKQCPDVKRASDVYGAFVPALVKVEMLKFLATHPGRIDAVGNAGAMGAGIMSAFQQTGRPIPIVGDSAAVKGSLGYWLENKGKYHGAGYGLGPDWIGSAAARVARRMLAGQGVKITEISDDLPQITDDNIDDWADPSWNVNTPGQAPGPKNTFVPDDYLNGLFERGETPK